MTHLDDERDPADLMHVVARLRDQRPEASALELDRIKLRAQKRATRGAPASKLGKGQFMTRRIITVMLVLGLVGATGAVAATGGGGLLSSGSSDEGASAPQYCDPVQGETHHHLINHRHAHQHGQQFIHNHKHHHHQVHRHPIQETPGCPKYEPHRHFPPSHQRNHHGPNF